MKLNLSILKVILLITFFNVITGCGNKNPHSERIVMLAEGMYDYFLIEDYYSFVDYMYPELVDKMGGVDNVIEVTKQGINQMKDNNSEILEVSFGKPKKLYKVDSVNELQCILPQILKMKINDKLYIQKGYLIAISNDNGESWSFMDTSAGNIEAFRKSFPNLHSKLHIPKKKAPKLLEE